MCNRVVSADIVSRRLASAASRQVPSAVDLGPPPGAALVQEPDNQKRLDDQRAGRAENCEPVFFPQLGLR